MEKSAMERNITMVMVGMQMVFLSVWIVMVALLIARVLFAMAAYYDACSKMNPNAVMWGLLIGFLGLIPGIIYLCIRNDTGRGPINCPKCGILYHSGYHNCPQCGEVNPVNNMYLNPFILQQQNRAKKLCVAAGVIIGAAVFIAIMCFVLFLVRSDFGFFYN
jgi:Ca2+/Na+ antiporter